MKTTSDNMTLGKLVIGLGVLVLLLWLIKVILFFLIDLTATFLTACLYIFLIYALIMFSLSVYAYFSSEKTPKIVKIALKFNHGVAVGASYLFKFFDKK